MKDAQWIVERSNYRPLETYAVLGSDDGSPQEDYYFLNGKVSQHSEYLRIRYRQCLRATMRVAVTP